MTGQTAPALLFLVIFLLLVAVTHALYVFFKLPAEVSRKFLHVSGGILCLCAPYFIQSHWWVLGLCSAAFMLLLYTYHNQLLPSVHQTRRQSIGSVIFPIPIYLCFLAAQKMEHYFLFYVPVSLLTVSDTMAEWSGKKWSKTSVKLMNSQKTVIGSLCFALCSLLIIFICGYAYGLVPEHILIIALVTTTAATLAELVSTKGLDNFTVPVIALLCLLALKNLL